MVDLKSNLRPHIRSIVSSHICCLFPLTAVLVWAPERLNWSPALLIGKCKIFAMMTSFYLENIDIGSPNSQLKEFLYRPTYLPNFLFLLNYLCVKQALTASVNWRIQKAVSDATGHTYLSFSKFQMNFGVCFLMRTVQS